MGSKGLSRAKLLAYRRSQGIRSATPVGPTVAHINFLRTHPDGGMSMQAIADEAAVAVSVISEVCSGKRNWLRDTTVARLLAVEYRGVETSTGARTDPTGTVRRIQALYAIGMTCGVMAGSMSNGRPNPRVIWHYLQHSHVTARTALEVKGMYEKLRDVDPRDMGIWQPMVTRNKNMARDHGWAPPSCWDDDEIDDPNAIAEWTGACGTMRGVHLHRTEVNIGRLRSEFRPVKYEFMADMANPAVRQYARAHISRSLLKRAMYTNLCDGPTPRRVANCENCWAVLTVTRKFPGLASMMGLKGDDVDE